MSKALNIFHFHKLDSMSENEKQKFLCEFSIQTGHPIQARIAGLIIVNKEKERKKRGREWISSQEILKRK